jgi:hypothetical protein
VVAYHACDAVYEGVGESVPRKVLLGYPSAFLCVFLLFHLELRGVVENARDTYDADVCALFTCDTFGEVDDPDQVSVSILCGVPGIPTHPVAVLAHRVVQMLADVLRHLCELLVRHAEFAYGVGLAHGIHLLKSLASFFMVVPYM